jgi:hypothetical protein
MSIQEETRIYADKVDWYINTTNIPTDLFQYPDHVDVVAPDLSEFEQLVKEPAKETAIIDHEDEERFHVMAKYAGVLFMGRLGYIRWAEITEANEQEQAAGIKGVQTLNFYAGNIKEVLRVFGWRDLDHTLVDHESHEEVIVPIMDSGDYFKFTSRPLESVVREKLESGEAHYLSS